MISNTFEELRMTGHLPSPSGVGMQILRLTQGDDFSTEEIGQAISADSALTGRLLKLANSAESGSMEPVTTIGEATIRLGIRTVRNVALGLSLVSSNRTGACIQFDYERYWALSLARAVAGQQLSRALQRGVPAEMYILGLLSGVGELALASVHPEVFGEILAEHADTATEEFGACELELFHITHSQVAACMLRDWGLPDEFGEAVSAYEAKRLTDVKPTLKLTVDLLRAADLLARIFVADETTTHSDWIAMAQEFSTLQEISGLEPEYFERICNTAATDWREWGQVLGIPTGARVDFGSLKECVALAGERALNESAGLGTRLGGADPGQALGSASAQDGALQILAVDDDAVSLKLLERHLIKAGHAVTTARDGEEALRLALETCPQLVVADWSMPGLDGIELCQALRKISSGQSIYFLLLTGVEGEESIVQAFDAGVDDYVVKPFNPRILMARINAGRRIISLQADLEFKCLNEEKHNMDLQVVTRKLRAAALTDPLTGLSNRRYAMKRLAQTWESATRTGKPVSVIMLDIDHFKKVNDSWGHDAGDEVLKSVAAGLEASCREEEDVCRIGGEEFIVICPNASGEEARAAAERIRESVSRDPIHWQGHDHHITISLGVACRTIEMADFEGMLKASDDAVYRAKHTGRNRVVLAGSDESELRKTG